MDSCVLRSLVVIGLPLSIFSTVLFHLCIRFSGVLCFDCNIVLEKIIEILIDPPAEGPLEIAVAEEMAKDRKKFNKTAKQWTKKHAK